MFAGEELWNAGVLIESNVLLTDEATLLNCTGDEMAEVMRLDWNSSMLEDAAQFITEDDGEQLIVAVLKKCHFVIKYDI